MKKTINSKKLLFENMEKLNPGFKLTEGVNFNMMFPVNDYRKKVNEIKAAIDKLLFDEDDDAIDTLYRLIVRRTKPTGSIAEALREELNRMDGLEEGSGRLVTMASDIHSDISKIPGITRLGLWSLADGFVGLYRYDKDGNAYEIEIRPIQLGKHKNLWGGLIKKKEDRNGEQ